MRKKTLGAELILFFFVFFVVVVVVFNNVIYLLILAVLCLCCLGFSLVAASGVTLHCVAWASHCSGFSCFRAWALGYSGFSSCGM